MRAYALFGALFGLGLGFQVGGCGGACSDTGSHECCAGQHCHCAGQHCNCADSPGSHGCLQAPASFECAVAWIDDQGEEVAVDVYLYENFDSPLGVQDTCNAQQVHNPDRPDEASTGVCSCIRTDFDTPAQLGTPF